MHITILKNGKRSKKSGFNFKLEPKMKISISTPQIVFPEEGKEQFNLEREESNKELLDEHIKNGKQFKYDNYIGYEIFNNDTGLGSIVLVHDDWVIFLFHYARVRIKSHDAYYERLVWQDKRYKGLARTMLMHVIDRTGVLICSNEHQPKGMLMWKKLISTNPQLYFYITNGKTLTPINDWDSKVWGTNEEFQKIKVVASLVLL